MGQKFRIADELFCYIVVVPNGNRRVPGRLDELVRRAWLDRIAGPQDLRPASHRHQRARRRAEVRRRLIDDGTHWRGGSVLAAGDGLLDADLLRAAFRGSRPRTANCTNWTSGATHA